MATEWVSEPSTSGEVAISDLPLGPHYFICSVGRHCALGMRLTVHVVPEQGEEEDNNDQVCSWLDDKG